MEKIEFADPSAIDLGDQLGIPQDRRETLAQHLDAMVKYAKEGKLRLVTTAAIISYIEDFCETRKEFLWAYTNHMQWLYNTGRMIQLK